MTSKTNKDSTVRSTKIKRACVFEPKPTVTAESLTVNSSDHATLVDYITKVTPLVGITLRYAKTDDADIRYQLHTRLLIGQTIVPVLIRGDRQMLDRCVKQGYAVGEFTHYTKPVAPTLQVRAITIFVQDTNDHSSHIAQIVEVDEATQVTPDLIPLHNLPNTFLKLVEREVMLVQQVETFCEAA